MAVNVDANHATSPPTYSMFACYQSGNIAVSWDAAGGFVQVRPHDPAPRAVSCVPAAGMVCQMHCFVNSSTYPTA